MLKIHFSSGFDKESEEFFQRGFLRINLNHGSKTP